MLRHTPVEVLVPVATLAGLGTVPSHMLQSAPSTVLSDVPVTKLEKMGKVPSNVLQSVPLDVLLRVTVPVLEITPIKILLKVQVESLLGDRASQSNGQDARQIASGSAGGTYLPRSQSLRSIPCESINQELPRNFSRVTTVNKKLELFGIKASWVQFTNIEVKMFQ